MTAAKSKKKQNAFSRINFKSAKTRGLLILIAFAVIGGGVMVFRSFAATNVIESWSYSRSNKLLNSEAIGTCKVTPLTEASKNSAPTFNLACPVGSTGYARAYSVGAAGAANNYYRACAMVKGSGNNVRISLKGSESSPGVQATMKLNGYTYTCDGTVKMRSSSGITAEVRAGSGSTANVSYVTIEHISEEDVTPITGPSTCEKNCTLGK